MSNKQLLGLGLVISALLGIGIVSSRPPTAKQLANQAQEKKFEENQAAARAQNGQLEESNKEAAYASRLQQIKTLKRSAVRKACQFHSAWSIEDCKIMDDKKVYVGMTSEQALLAWGKPDHVNVTTYSQTQHEQWVTAGGSYLYLENGIVTSIQTTK